MFDAGTLVAKIQADTKSFSDGINSAINQGKNFEKKSTGAFGSVGKVAVSVAKSVAGIAVAIGGIVLAIGPMADEYIRIQNQLRQRTDGTKKAVDELTDSIVAIANRARLPVEDMSLAFQRFDNAIQMRGGTKEETLQFIETLGKGLKLAGASTAEQSSAMLQLSQAMASGVLRGEEFNSIFEASPFIIEKIAQYMGIGIDQARTYAQEGKITADIVKNALIGASDEIDAKFQQTKMTSSDAFTVLKNNIAIEVGQIAEILGADTIFSGFLLRIAEFIPKASEYLQAFFDFFKTETKNTNDTVENENLNFWQRNLKSLKEIYNELVLTFQFWVLFFTDLWQQYGDNIQAIWTFLWENIKIILQTALDIITNVIKLVFALLRGDFSGAKDAFIGIWTALWNGLQGITNNIVAVFVVMKDRAVSLITELIQTIKNMLTELVESAYGFATNFVNMLVKGLRDGIAKVAQAAADLAGSIKSKLGFGSPTETGPASNSDEWAPNFTNMFVKGLADGKAKVTGMMSDIAGEMATLGGLSPNIGINATRASSFAQPVFNIYGNISSKEIAVDMLNEAFATMKGNLSYN